MKLKALCLATSAALLGACGGEAGDRPTYENWQIGEVYYSYPYDGQEGVSPKSPLILRFSHEVSVDSSHFTLLKCPSLGEACEDTGSNHVALRAPQSVGQGKGVVIQPSGPLDLTTHYRLVLSGIDTGNGEAQFEDGGLDFVTRMSASGPLSGQQMAPDLAISKVIPSGDPLQFMDFSTIRLQFNQQLETGSLVYGDTEADASVELEGPEGTVPAVLLVKGNAVTIDPIEDLNAGEQYTLKLTDAVRGVQQDGLTGGYSQTWTARNSMPRATLVQEVVQASEEAVNPCNAPDAISAMLTGSAMNCVPIQSTLLGGKDATLQSGDVRAELAFLPNYPDVSPLRIARNSLLTGSNIQVNVGGDVPAGIETGAIKVTFLSDASGYLVPNPYSDSHQAPKQVRLFMDVAMTAENPEANGGLSQTLMHVELNGMALVNDGRMEIDAVGVVEPTVLGQEQAFGLLSFHMKSYRDQENAPPLLPDMTAPVLQSMVPEANDSGVADKARPGDPVILNFSEPLDPTTLVAGQSLDLLSGGVSQPFDWELDGATLILRPQSSLAMGSTYQVQLSGTVTDLAGNPLAPLNREFSLPALVGEAVPPIALTSYPGFPCASDNEHWEIEAGNHGFCRGGKTEDDRNPVPQLPADRSIRVNFSQDMDPASIVFENSEACGVGSFRVEKVESDAQGAPIRYDEDGKRKYHCESGVTGELTIGARSLVFTPDQPWEEGVSYRYILMSVNGTGSQQANDCSSGEAICSVAGKRLQTAVLEAPDNDMGGPNMHLHFVGAAATDSVFQPLRNLPTADLNGNGQFDDGEPGYQGNGAGVNTTGLVVDDYDGDGILSDPELLCDVPERCDIHVVGALDTEVFGSAVYRDLQSGETIIDPETGEPMRAVRVGLYPTMIQASSVTLLVKIIGLIPSETPTETQYMRMRYSCVAWPVDAENYCGKTNPDGSFVYDEIERQGLIPGWIVETESGPEFRTDVEVYLDAPDMHIVLDGSHSLHSAPLTLNLSGPVTFLPDGRMVIGQLNSNAVPIDVKLGIELGFIPLANPEINLQIPPNGLHLQYLGEPIKQ
ncbi:Ig-like domain-containing protein [Alcanivorax sp. S6407]|uniref:Ig-like domain-containing protein n=1 Tax=Alcanivorax sp. S6407 TaxID=2926424 RepID=UPI001FF360A0|nr:Ig-like domain-containing protein [Alcanivorax sp. S6407]MCK0154245.1 Ig-like domain-containing protein [Alcanivorax sp. S6407]